MSNILFLKGRMEWKRLEVWKDERWMEGRVLDVLDGILEFEGKKKFKHGRTTISGTYT